MSYRYRLQRQIPNTKEWVDTELLFKTKLELGEFIGNYNIDYEWRVGYLFKPYGKPLSRFVWNGYGKDGQEVKIR